MVKSGSTGQGVLFRHTLCLRAIFLMFLAPHVLIGGGPSSESRIRPPVASGPQSSVVARDRFATVEFESGMASATGILVKLKEPNRRPASVTAMLAQKNMEVGRTFKSVPGLQRISRKAGPQGQSFSRDELLATIKALEASGLYEYVEPDWTVHLLQTPSDTAFTNGTLWGLQNTGQSGGTSGIDVNAVSAWGVTTGDPNVIVGVIDTGVRYSHQDLIGNMWVNAGEIPGNSVDDDGNGYVDDVYGINAITGSGDPMDDHDHGTHVAGTIAATANDAGQHVGVAYGTKIMALKFIAASGTGATSDAIACIDYAIEQGVDILNNSWGGGGFSQALLDAINAANDAGILFVAAAGNSALDNDVSPHYPSNYEVANIVAVAAIDRNGLLAGFSNYGTNSVDLGAPGVAILSCTASSDSSYASFEGTSMASPHVAGVAALLASQYPSAGVAELKNRLFMTSSPLASLAGRVETGGMVDAHAALLVTGDGDLELWASSNGALREGLESDFYITVTDVSPVTGATVTGDLDAGASQAFLDDGVSPDLIAGDGVYSATLLVPSGVNSTELNVQVSAAGKNPASDTFTFAILMPSQNDDFTNALILTGVEGQLSGATLGATGESGEPNHAGVSSPLASVWYRWTAPADGTFEVITFGSDFDTTLAVYTGSAVDALTEVASNDNFIISQSYVAFEATAGITYYIAVDGFATAAGQLVLTHAFTVLPSPPANDDFENALDLGSDSTSTGGSNAGATGEAGEPNHAANSTPLASAWWLWTPLVSGSVTISTVGSDFDTTLAVYTGGSVAALTEIASNDDIDYPVNFQSEVTFPVSSEAIYYIAVDGYGAEAGNVVLTVTYTPVTVPEIEVEHSGVSVVDGFSTIDFGSVAIGVSAERTLTVRNIGTVALSGLSISITGSHALTIWHHPYRCLWQLGTVRISA
jgi:subtilisin family serine protease